MEKVRLNVDDLQVQSFATREMTEERGTVRAHAPSDEVECYTAAEEWQTCAITCDCQNDWTIPCTDNCNETNYGFCSGSRG